MKLPNRRAMRDPKKRGQALKQSIQDFVQAYLESPDAKQDWEALAPNQRMSLIAKFAAIVTPKEVDQPAPEPFTRPLLEGGAPLPPDKPQELPSDDDLIGE